MSENLITKVLSIDELMFFRVKANEKRPATLHGYKDAKIGFDIASTLKNGDNVGFVMEPRFLCIDMDEDKEKGYEGIKVIQELEKVLGKLPRTYTQRTPRMGLHKVFLSDGLINKPRGKITPACDLKYSGYILFHGSKINQRYYHAIDGVEENGKLYFSSLPKKWIDFIQKNGSDIKNVEKSYTHYEPLKITGNFKKMYEKCAFVRNCVDSSFDLSEPEWHMFARLLNHFDNGLELFLEFSKRHIDFNPEKATKKFLYAKRYPVNCSSISEISEACMSCINLIKRR